MVDSADVIHVALLALLTGIALPLLIQAFFTLRRFHRTVARMEKRIDPLLTDVQELVAHFKGVSTSKGQVPSVIAALIPAAVAAVQTFTACLRGPGPETENNHPDGNPNGNNLSDTQPLEVHSKKPNKETKP